MGDIWPGVVVRCNVSEKGEVPRVSTSNSPDIIIAGTEPLKNPSVLTDPANYNNAYNNSLYIGRPNFLYVRGKNYTTGALSGTWNLFWSKPNVLQFPYMWEKNQLATSTDNQNPPFTLQAGAIGASNDCFTWVPPDFEDHYCMIAVANTPGHGNPVQGMSHVSNLAEYYTTNANIAQRNVQMIRGNQPSMVTTAPYSQGDEAATMDLAVVFENLPKGSSYTVGSGTPLNGEALSHSESNTQSSKFKYAWVDLDIPAQWNTVFSVALTFGNDWSGIPPTALPTVTVRGELVVDSTHRLYNAGLVADPHPRTGNLRLDSVGQVVKVIPVGSIRSIFQDVKPR